MNAVLNLLVVIPSFLAAVLAATYEVAIRTEEGEVVNWGTLKLSPADRGVIDYTPSSTPRDTELREGCIGVIQNGHFVCQTLFKIGEEPRYAVKAVLGPDGSLAQVQLVRGERSEAFVEVPSIVPRAELKKAPQRAATNVAPTAAEDDAEEVAPKSFLEQYWMYLIPAAIVVISNMMKATGEQQQDGGAE